AVGTGLSTRHALFSSVAGTTGPPLGFAMMMSSGWSNVCTRAPLELQRAVMSNTWLPTVKPDASVVGAGLGSSLRVSWSPATGADEAFQAPGGIVTRAEESAAGSVVGAGGGVASWTYGGAREHTEAVGQGR